MNSKFIIFYVVTAACVSRSPAEDVDCTEVLSLKHLKTCCPLPEFFTNEIKELCREYYDPPSAEVNEESEESTRRRRRQSADVNEESEESTPRPRPPSGEVNEESEESTLRPRAPICEVNQESEESTPRPRPPSAEVSEELDPPPPNTQCFMQCAFNATGILGPDNTLDEEKMEEYLSRVFTDVPEIIPTMEQSLRTCFAKDAIWKAEMKELATQSAEDPLTCHPAYIKVWSCVFTETFKYCPTSLWDDTKECNKANAFFTQCTPTNLWRLIKREQRQQ